MDELLSSLSALMMSNALIAPFLAFLAGLISSFAPCALSSMPLVLGVVGGSGAKAPGRALGLSLTFALGSAISFTALGVVASLAGSLLGAASSWWYMLLGLLMLLMALQTWELFVFIPSSLLSSKNSKKGHIGALLAGVLGGLFSSPCATPVLVALLALVAGQGSPAWGVLLLLCYSAGHGLLAVLCGSSVGFVSKLTANPRFGAASRVVKLVMGSLLCLIGFILFYFAF